MKQLRTDIWTVLTEDATYISRMGSPASVPFQTFYIKPPEKPTFPETVFHFPGTTYGQEHDRDILSSRVQVVFSIWTVDEDYNSIADRIIFLLHQKEQSNGWRAILAFASDEVYDSEFDTYGKRLTFDVSYRSDNT